MTLCDARLTIPRNRPRRAGRSVLSYVFPIALLMVVIGGVAWVAQNLPKWRSQPARIEAPPKATKLLEFTRVIAQWENPVQPPPATGELKDAGFNAKDVETGTTGHYDFFFRNSSDVDVELVYYTSACDCASVQARAVPVAEWVPLEARHRAKPADVPDDENAPMWTTLAKDIKDAKAMLVKANEAGIVRVNWAVRKGPGTNLQVMPAIWFRPLGDGGKTEAQRLAVPIIANLPVTIDPPRVNVGELSPGSSAQAEFRVWSSTRDTLDLKFSPLDAFFNISLKPLTKAECANLEAAMKAPSSPEDAKQPPKIGSRVRSGYYVTVTAHESKAGRQLDQGSFYRKLDLILDGVVAREINGPEIVGRVQGDIIVGGTDDRRKVSFASFDAKNGASKTVDLSVNDKVKLEPFTHMPAWIEVELRRTDEVPSAGRRIWKLKVTVPPDTPGARSFDEPDAVVLRIVGMEKRLIRIPLDGSVRGR